MRNKVPGKVNTYIPALGRPESTTGRALSRHCIGQGSNPCLHLNLSGLSRCCLSCTKKEKTTRIRYINKRFSNDCRKTKTKAITPTNHNRSRQRHEPITIPSNIPVITCNSLKAREKSRVHGANGFDFASRWWKNWRVF